ncbi:hypothetical protein M8J77_003898 [Diaphorina citri]|nr:hypothetical protein M8J77_003898 [Diaphorina citri]
MNVPLPKFELKSFTKKEMSEMKRKFNLYAQATELSKKGKEVQVAHLRLTFDETLNDIIDQLNLENPTVDEVFKGLEDQLIPKDNIAFQQLEFFKRVQKPGLDITAQLIQIMGIEDRQIIVIKDHQIMDIRNNQIMDTEDLICLIIQQMFLIKVISLMKQPTGKVKIQNALNV